MIHPEVKPILIFLIALFTSMFMLPKLANIAKSINLMDQPSQRKVHTEPKPLVGGIGFILSACFAAALIVPAKGLRGFFAGLALMLFIGFLDDYKELGHRQKFLGQIFAASLLIYFSNIRLISFGDLLGVGELTIPGYWFSVLVSIFCILGVINSINLIDGLDGLAGGIGFIAFILFAAHASFAQDQTFLLLNLSFAGALLGFLRFNWFPAKLFMGDAGSLCLGFTLAFMAIAMTQGDDACMPPIAALLILAVPISDTLTVMTKRFIQRKSLFQPDKRHLHHIFMRHGFSRETTVKIIIGISTILGSISILGPLYSLDDSTLFLLFTSYFIVYFISSFFILDLLRYSFRLCRTRDSCDTPCRVIRSFCRLLDTINIIRQATRYDVSLPIQCYTDDPKKPLEGTILNISKGGFMALIPELTTLESDILTDINLTNQPSANPSQTQFMTEHLWISTLDGNHIHGFKFTKLTAQQRIELNHLIDA